MEFRDCVLSMCEVFSTKPLELVGVAGVTEPLDIVPETALVAFIDLGVNDGVDFKFFFTIDDERLGRIGDTVGDGIGSFGFEYGDVENGVDLFHGGREF